jgi:hypothetical protein
VNAEVGWVERARETHHNARGMVGFASPRLGKNVSATDPLRFAGAKPGSNLPLHEPVKAATALQSLAKSAAAEPWVPACPTELVPPGLTIPGRGPGLCRGQAPG